MEVLSRFNAEFHHKVGEGLAFMEVKGLYLMSHFSSSTVHLTICLEMLSFYKVCFNYNWLYSIGCSKKHGLSFLAVITMVWANFSSGKLRISTS